MKKLSVFFAAAAVVLSQVMCFVTGFNYADMLWGIQFGYSAPASTAFLIMIPYGLAILICAALSVILWRRGKKST